jgi:mono/diheme cytochrome c family protein
MLHHVRTALPMLALVAGPAMAQDADGAAIFEQTCAGCHGADSELSAASMAGLEQEAFAEALAGHPEVGGVADLSEDDISALHAYVAGEG